MDLIDKYLQQEEMKSDTGWKKAETERKDQYGNRIKRVAKSLAKQGMQAAIKDLKKGPEAGKRQVEEVDTGQASARKTTPSSKEAQQKVFDKHKERMKQLAKEEVEELDELKQDTLTSYADKAEKDIKDKKREFKAQGGEMRTKSQRELDAKISNRYKGLFTAQRKAGLPQGFKEEAELDEGLKSKLAAMGVAATMAASPAAARVSDGGQSFAQQTAQQTTQPQSVKAPKEIPSKSYLQNVASGKSRSMMHPDTAKELLKKHYSEEVDLVSKYSKLGEVYDRSNMMSHSGFKSREMSTELGHEDNLPHSVHITNSSGQKKKWKTFSNRPQAEKAASTLRAKGVTAHASIG